MYLRLASVTLFLVYVLIVVGAATRVFDAGMSCPDWPTCYGVWNPFHPTAVPPGGYVVEGISYTWWQVALEWSHRLLAAAAGGLMLLLAAGAVRRGTHEWLPLATAFVLLLVQIKLGAITVWFSNVNWSVFAHLGVAMLLFGSLAWHRRAVAAGAPPYKRLPTPPGVKALAVLTVIAVWCTMGIGAYVSSSHAGGICGGLFSCGGEWLPADLSQLAHMKHRYMAVVVFVLSIVLMAVTKRRAAHLQTTAIAFHNMVLGQVLLGVATLYSFGSYPQYYQVLSIAHLAWGTLVWLVAMGLLLNIRYGKEGRFHA